MNDAVFQMFNMFVFSKNAAARHVTTFMIRAKGINCVCNMKHQFGWIHKCTLDFTFENVDFPLSDG